MIMYTTDTDVMPPGTVSASNCGGRRQRAQRPGLDLRRAERRWPRSRCRPTTAPASRSRRRSRRTPPAYFQMHYLNPSDEPIKVARDAQRRGATPPARRTRRPPRTSRTTTRSQHPGRTRRTTSRRKTCNAPAGAKFWMMSTHAHKQAVKTEVKNGCRRARRSRSRAPTGSTRARRRGWRRRSTRSRATS